MFGLHAVLSSEEIVGFVNCVRARGGGAIHNPDCVTLYAICKFRIPFQLVSDLLI